MRSVAFGHFADGAHHGVAVGPSDNKDLVEDLVSHDARHGPMIELFGCRCTSSAETTAQAWKEILLFQRAYRVIHRGT